METVAKYLGMSGVFGLIGRAFGWWKGWGWVFLGCLLMSFMLFIILQKRGKV